MASDDDIRAAYVAGLTMLARRELSESQIRQRLLRKKYSPDAVDAAITRLKTERALDDVRVAESLARTEVNIRRRGRLRVERRIQSAGIAASTARQAVERVYTEVDSDALLSAALERRLRAGSKVADQKVFTRLYRYLIGQGFESDKVIAALKRRSKHSADDD